MNLDHNINFVNPKHYSVEVLINQDSILDFPICPHILSICNLEYITLGIQCSFLANQLQ